MLVVVLFGGILGVIWNTSSDTRDRVIRIEAQVEILMERINNNSLIVNGN